MNSIQFKSKIQYELTLTNRFLIVTISQIQDIEMSDLTTMAGVTMATIGTSTHALRRGRALQPSDRDSAMEAVAVRSAERAEASMDTETAVPYDSVSLHAVDEPSPAILRGSLPTLSTFQTSRAESAAATTAAISSVLPMPTKLFLVHSVKQD